MSRYYCHEYPEVLVLETRVVAARPGAVLLDQSPFHPGGGGQLADRGLVRWNGGDVRVSGIEAAGGRYWHLLSEPVEMAGTVEVVVDAAFRRGRLDPGRRDRRARPAGLRRDPPGLHRPVARGANPEDRQQGASQPA